jgi:hypothetical protein
VLIPLPENGRRKRKKEEKTNQKFVQLPQVTHPHHSSNYTVIISSGCSSSSSSSAGVRLIRPFSLRFPFSLLSSLNRSLYLYSVLADCCRYCCSTTVGSLGVKNWIRFLVEVEKIIGVHFCFPSFATLCPPFPSLL